MHSTAFLALLATVLARPMLAQQLPPLPPVPVSTDDELTRDIPDTLGAGSATRVVRLDADGDLLPDLAILWSTGAVTFCSSPAILPAFVPCPTTSAKDIACIPGAMGTAAMQGRDGLLIANGTTLDLMTYDAGLAESDPLATGFTTAPVAADAAWQQVERIVAQPIGSVCWLLGLASDRRQVHLGAWTSTGIADFGSMTAASNVKQMTLVDFDGDGQLTVVARTTAGLEMWDMSGVPLCSPIAAPANNALGGMTSVRDGDQHHIAWLALLGSSWELRILHGPAMLQQTTISEPTYLPDRFLPVSLGATGSPGSDTDSLVLFQSSSAWQLVFTNPNGTGWALSSAFYFADTTYSVDVCPALLDDIDNDGIADFTSVLTSQHRVQIRRRVADWFAGSSQVQPLQASTDLLPVDCTLSQSALSEVPDDTLNLNVLVPPQLLDLDGLEAQVVAWSQNVADPTQPLSPADPIGPALLNTFYPLDTGNGIETHPVLSLALPPEVDGRWLPNHHYYLMLRFVLRQNGTLIYSSPAQMVAFVANYGSFPTYPGLLNYLFSIMTGGTNHVRVWGGDRNVGVIQKPDHIDPPSSTTKVPSPSQSTTRPISGAWQ